MKKYILAIVVATIGFSSVALAQQSTVTKLYNYENSSYESVDVSSLSESEAIDVYLPDNPTVIKLYKAYKSQGNGVGYALISTVLDLKTAAGNASVMFNFTTGKKESVVIEKLTFEEAQSFIPQQPAALQLFNFYYREESDLAVAIQKTLKDTLEIINSIPKSE